MTKTTVLILTALLFMGAKCEDETNYYDYDFEFENNEYVEHNKEGDTMALNPSTLPEYSGRIVPADPLTWPYGSALDDTGGNTGTPAIAKYRSDVWGLLQALLLKANIIPNGDADPAVGGQYALALDTMPFSLTQIAEKGTSSIATETGSFNYSLTVQATDGIIQIIKTKTSKTTSFADLSQSTPTDSYQKNTDDSGDTIESTSNSKGVMYSGTRHPTDDTPRFNKSILDLSGSTVTFSQIILSSGDRVPTWVGNEYVDTGIPDTCDILGATAVFDLNYTVTEIQGSPVKYSLQSSGGTWHMLFSVDTLYNDSLYQPRHDNMKLSIEFDGTNL